MRVSSQWGGGGGVGDVDTPCDDQYEEVPPERGTYSGVQVYKVGKSVLLSLLTNKTNKLL